jgi:hypothetical protein
MPEPPQPADYSLDNNWLCLPGRPDPCGGDISYTSIAASGKVTVNTPPPPPANVPAIEPNPPQNPKATLREKIEAHRNDANCSACHAKIDPLGLAWDNYDAIGQWRTREKVPAGVGEDPLINPAGLMPNGRAFKDATEFKQRLLEDHDKVARAFIEQLCTYGLRRVLTVDDEDDLKLIEEEAKKNDYRVKDIVRAVALSELMRKR